MDKILWHSNAPYVGSGYGVQTALFVPKLAEHYNVAISANYGLEGAVLAWQGIPILPGLGQDHGNATLPGHIKRYFGEPRDGLVVTLYDVPPFDANLFARHNVACWVPVDHSPATPAQVAFFRGSQAIPLAMSHYAEEQLAEFDPIYVPHGVDTEAYKPRPSDFREQIGAGEDTFLVGMVAANKGRPSRKCFQEAFEAVAALSKRHDNVKLYVHTVVSPEWAGGEDIVALLGSLELNASLPQQYDVIYDPPSAERMAAIYSGFDVLLNPSMGEGFGVPVLEAAACGTPAIVGDFSAMPEVAGPGWKVPGHPVWTGQHSWMQRPSVPALVKALEKAYGMGRHEAEERSASVREHASHYDATRVFNEHMLPALHEVEARLGNRAPVEVKAA